MAMEIAGKDAFPTPVGMNLNLFLYSVLIGRVPHTRGDEPVAIFSMASALTRSPHPWG